MLHQDPQLKIFWEMPSDSLELERRLWERNCEWLRCRVDGCRYGLRTETGDKFILKKWQVMTNCNTFHQLYKCKTCVQNHCHLAAQEVENLGRLEYP